MPKKCNIYIYNNYTYTYRENPHTHNFLVMMGKKTQRSAFVGTVCLPDKMVKAKECCSPTGSKTTFFRQIKAEMTKKNVVRAV